MATITISVPESLDEVKRRFPKIDWNEVLKRGVIKRLEELKRFEKLKEREGV